MKPHALLALAALAPLAPVAEAKTKPNIILVLTDDLGIGDLGVHHQNERARKGLPAIVTPNLDQFAGKGVRLDRHYTAAPVCAPARASLLTGVHQGHCDLRDNQFDKALENNLTLASLLRSAGYSTAVIGKWGVQGPGTATEMPAHPLRRGFDYFYGPAAHLTGHFHYPKENPGKDNQGQPTAVFENEVNITDALDKAYSTDLYTARAKAWIAERAAKEPARPFFLYLAYTAPHARLDVPTGPYPAGRGLRGGLQYSGKPGAVINTAKGEINSWIHPDYAAKPWPAHAKRHATMVRRLDDAMGDLLATLKDLNIDRDTLIVFTSDNGAHHECGFGGKFTQDPSFFQSYGDFDGLKRDVLEGGVHVPALVRWPAAAPAGRAVARPSQFHDWMATFAEAAGLPVPARTDGVSLLSDLTGQGERPDSTVYVEYAIRGGKTPAIKDFAASNRGRAQGQMQSIEIDGYKGLRYDIKRADADFEIYEPAKDTHEARNLADSSEKFRALNARMKAEVLRLRRANPTAARPYDSAAVPALAAPKETAPGLLRRTLEKPSPWVPAPREFAAASATPSSDFETPPGAGTVQWEGFITVPADGVYTFHITAGGRAFARLHRAILIDADTAADAAPGKTVSTSIKLAAGTHAITLGFVPAGEKSSLKLEWEGPGLAREAVPSSAFSHAK